MKNKNIFVSLLVLGLALLLASCAAPEAPVAVDCTDCPQVGGVSGCS